MNDRKNVKRFIAGMVVGVVLAFLLMGLIRAANGISSVSAQEPPGCQVTTLVYAPGERFGPKIQQAIDKATATGWQFRQIVVPPDRHSFGIYWDFHIIACR